MCDPADGAQFEGGGCVGVCVVGGVGGMGWDGMGFLNIIFVKSCGLVSMPPPVCTRKVIKFCSLDCEEAADGPSRGLFYSRCGFISARPSLSLKWRIVAAHRLIAQSRVTPTECGDKLFVSRINAPQRPTCGSELPSLCADALTSLSSATISGRAAAFLFHFHTLTRASRCELETLREQDQDQVMCRCDKTGL